MVFSILLASRILLCGFCQPSRRKTTFFRKHSVAIPNISNPYEVTEWTKLNSSSSLYSSPTFLFLVMKNSYSPWPFALSSSPKNWQHISMPFLAQAQPAPRQTHTLSCPQAIRFTKHSYLPPYPTSLLKNTNTLLLALPTNRVHQFKMMSRGWRDAALALNEQRNFTFGSWGYRTLT